MIFGKSSWWLMSEIRVGCVRYVYRSYMYIHTYTKSCLYMQYVYNHIYSVYFKIRNWNLLLQCDVSWNEVPLWNFLVNYCDWTKYILNILNIHHDYRGFLISKKLLNVAPLKHLKMKLFPNKLIYPLNIDGWKLEDDSFPFSFISRGGKPTHLFCWSIPRAIGMRPIPLVPFWVAWVLGICNV